MQASPVKQHAVTYRFVPILQPPSLRHTDEYLQEAAEVIDTLAVQRPDAMVAAVYGLILPQEVFDLPRFGYINVRVLLLSRWCGAAFIRRATEADGTEPGIMFT